MAERTGLYAFGWNGAGQLGTGDKEDMKVRPPPQASTQQLRRACSLRLPPPQWRSEADQPLAPAPQTPGRVAPLTDKRVCMVACGGPYTVLATDDEQVWAFGANARGQLGLGAEQTEDESMEPMLLSPPQGLLSWKVELIACGYAHTVFLTDNLCVPAPPPRSHPAANFAEPIDRCAH